MAYKRIKNSEYGITYVQGICDVLYINISNVATKLETLKAELTRVEKNLSTWINGKYLFELLCCLEEDIKKDMTTIVPMTDNAVQNRDYVYVPCDEATEFPFVIICKFVSK